MGKIAATGLRRAKQSESLYHHSHIPQTEMLGQGLGTETHNVEVSLGERTSVGYVETAQGARG